MCWRGLTARDSDSNQGKARVVLLRHASCVPVKMVPERAESARRVQEGRNTSFRLEETGGFVPEDPRGLCVTARRYADSGIVRQRGSSLTAWNGGRIRLGQEVNNRGTMSRKGNATRMIDGRFPVEPVLLRQGGVNV